MPVTDATDFGGYVTHLSRTEGECDPMDTEKELNEALDIIETLLVIIKKETWRAYVTAQQKKQILEFLNRHKLTSQVSLRRRNGTL